MIQAIEEAAQVRLSHIKPFRSVLLVELQNVRNSVVMLWGPYTSRCAAERNAGGIECRIKDIPELARRQALNHPILDRVNGDGAHFERLAFGNGDDAGCGEDETVRA